MTPVLTFFNNKGGVGKTSLVYHAAWMLSELDHTVLGRRSRSPGESHGRLSGRGYAGRDLERPGLIVRQHDPPMRSPARPGGRHQGSRAAAALGRAVPAAGRSGPVRFRGSAVDGMAELPGQHEPVPRVSRDHRVLAGGPEGRRAVGRRHRAGRRRPQPGGHQPFRPDCCRLRRGAAGRRPVLPAGIAQPGSDPLPVAGRLDEAPRELGRARVRPADRQHAANRLSDSAARGSTEPSHQGLRPVGKADAGRVLSQRVGRTNSRRAVGSGRPTDIASPP